MEEEELVSIIIPVYNRPNKSIKSIKTALKQSYENYEVIVIDDGSADDTWDRICEINDEKVITLRHEKNKGGNSARNTGIDHASGKYLAFLDSDDLWHPDKLERQVSYIQKTNYDAVYCDTSPQYQSTIRTVKNSIEEKIISSIGDDATKPSGSSELIPLVLSTNFQLGGSSTLFIKKEFIERIGNWDEQFQRHQDWELLVRILKHGSIGYINEKLVIKPDTGSPEYEVYVKEKKKLLLKYSDEIVLAELNGYSIISEQHYALAKHALRNQRLDQAIDHILYSDVRSPIRLLLLLQPLIRGRLFS